MFVDFLIYIYIAIHHNVFPIMYNYKELAIALLIYKNYKDNKLRACQHHDHSIK